MTARADGLGVLGEIVASVRARLAERVAALPLAEVRALAADTPAPPSFRRALREGPGKLVGGALEPVRREAPEQGGPPLPRNGGVPVAGRSPRNGEGPRGIHSRGGVPVASQRGGAPPPLKTAPRVIAELKRASPSRGLIAPCADAVRVAHAYRAAGAAAISILTEPRWFQGSLDDLAGAAAALEGSIPLLRKDFIVAAYQVFEARAAGASAVLLIAALHEGPALADLIGACAGAGVDALVEVHDEGDLASALAAGAAAHVIGVNNRDLKTLQVDLGTSLRLAPEIGPALKIAESGIGGRSDMDRLAALGYDGFLIGERLMKEADPGAALARLLGPDAAAMAGERAGEEA